MTITPLFSDGSRRDGPAPETVLADVGARHGHVRLRVQGCERLPEAAGPHGHAHAHSHAHAHTHHGAPGAAAAGRAAHSGPRFSVLRPALPVRLAVAAGISLALWAAIAWALTPIAG